MKNMYTIYALLSTLVFVGVAAQRPPAEVRYQWNYMNFTWPSLEAHDRAISNGDYIPKHNPVSGIKVWKDKMFLTIPRMRHGVPATLTTTSLEPVDGNKSPNVEPYPNWQMQKIGDCNAFQFVQSMEIDPIGRMWVLDTGRLEIFEENKSLCPPRLVIIDLEDNGRILLTHTFSKDVVDPDTGYLNDIVLDHEDGGYAYISNLDNEKPSIVVFSLKERKSWQVMHESMKATEALIEVKNDDVKVTQPFNIDSIALSSASGKGQRILYYAPLSSLEIFTIPTTILKKNPRQFKSQVKNLGKKPSQTDGMIISADDDLYFGLVSQNTVSKWNTNEQPFSEHQKRIFEDDVELQWPDAFAIDESGNLWVTSNKLQRILTDQYDVDKVNFRVMKLEQLKCKSYQYYKDGVVPPLPVIKPNIEERTRCQQHWWSVECFLGNLVQFLF